MSARASFFDVIIQKELMLRVCEWLEHDWRLALIAATTSTLHEHYLLEIEGLRADGWSRAAHGRTVLERQGERIRGE